MPKTLICGLIAMLMLLVGALADARAAGNEGPLVLDAGQSVLVPDRALRYWVDLRADSTLANAQDAERSGAFKPVLSWPPTHGFADGVYWFKLDLRNQNHPDDDWLYVIEYALLDYVDLHVIYGDGRRETQHSGDRLPYASRHVDHRFFSFGLRLPPGDTAETWLRVATESSVQVPIKIYSNHAFLERNQRSQLGLGIYYGVLVGLLLYNLLLYLSVRDRSYPFYVAYVASFGLGQACLNGLSYQLLWPNWPVWDDVVLLLSIGSALLFMLLFTSNFLELSSRQPRFHQVFRYAILILSAVTVSSPFVAYRHAILVETASVFLLAALVVTAGIRALRGGYRPAFYFLLAWSFMLLGIVVYASVSFGLAPKTFFTEYGIQIGSCIEMILLSLGLAYRFNLLAEQNEHLQREANERLEARVSERTAELNRALGDLRTANRRLHEFSLRDGLTGVHNRRYLDETLAHALSQAREREAPIALMMIDIDHFKHINDTRGHLAGDDCLRAVAETLRRLVREGEDLVARYGGEEFIIVLPGATRDEAVARADALREKVAALSIGGHGEPIRLTISIGLAVLAGTETQSGPDRLIRAADAALYRAKHDGRNRVVLAD